MISVEIRDDSMEFMMIYLNNESWRRIAFSIFGRKFSIPVNFESSLKFFDWFNEIEYKYAKFYCFRRLAKQNYLSYQLKRLLARKNVQSHTIERLIDELRNGYLDDEGWISQFIRAKSSKMGSKAIVWALIKKGIPKDLIDQCLNSSFQVGERDRILRMIENKSKLKGWSTSHSREDRKKLMSYFLRRGFSYDEIMAIWA